MKKKGVFIAVTDPASRQEIMLAVAQDAAFILLGWADNLSDAKSQLDRYSPELLFLDVRLAGGNGFKLMNEISRSITTVFVDEDGSQALKTFSHHTIDFLIKPVSSQSAGRAVNKYKLWNSMIMQALLTETAPLTVSYPKKILVEYGSRRKSLAVADILYLKADRDYSWICTINEEMFLSSFGISELEKRLDPARFIRIHRSYIINADYIKELYRDISKTFVSLDSNIELSVGRRYLSNLKELVF